MFGYDKRLRNSRASDKFMFCNQRPKRMNAKEIDRARRLLGLGLDATAAEVKKSYRVLANKHHPDKKGDEENFANIQRAYSLLKDYMSGYRYSFSLGEFRNQYPNEQWLKRYQNDPLWGKTAVKMKGKNESRKSY